jgi:hypothetical protein
MFKKVSLFFSKNFQKEANFEIVRKSHTRMSEIAHEFTLASTGFRGREIRSRSPILFGQFCCEENPNIFSDRFVEACVVATRLEVSALLIPNDSVLIVVILYGIHNKVILTVDARMKPNGEIERTGERYLPN